MRGQITHADEVDGVTRGSGISTLPFFGEWSGAEQMSTGMTVFPPGGGVVMHSHNVEECVTVIEGEGTAVIDGEEFAVRTWSTTWIPAGVPHRFYNSGSGQMRILWVYGDADVTRTVTETGETFKHLSASDRQTGSKG